MPDSPLVASRSDLPVERFSWGSLQWLCNERLQPGAQQTLGICELYAGCQNPRHFHPNCEEVLHVLAGRGDHEIEGKAFPLETGDTIRIPQGVKHKLANTGTEPLVCLIAFSSGDRQTIFLEEV